MEKHDVIFVIFDGQKIQLEERVKKEDVFYGYTTIPGGKMESGETLESALEREVDEEYGVKVLKSRKLGIIQSVERDGRLNFRHVYIVSEWGGNLSNPEGRNRHLEATIQEAKEICIHPISQRILDLVEEGLSTQDC